MKQRPVPPINLLQLLLAVLLLDAVVSPSLPTNYIYQYSDGTKEYSNTHVLSLRRDFGDQSIIATPDASYHVSTTFLGTTVDEPICIQIDGTVGFPGTSDPTQRLGSGSFYGKPAEIWAGYGDELWYVENSTLGILIPLGLAFPFGHTTIFEDVSIVIPNAADFEHPSCYNFYEDPTNSDDVFTFPPTHSYSLKDHDNILHTYTVDDTTNQLSIIKYGADNNVYYDVRRNNTNYSYITPLNISPTPCVISKIDIENRFLRGTTTFMDTFYIDSLGYFDAYTTGNDTPDEYVLFTQKENPIASFRPFGRQGPQLIVGYSQQADPKNFAVPHCFSPFTQPMKRDFLAPPTLPPDFTLYYTPLDGRTHTQSGVIYYDAPNARIRVDHPGRETYLAIGQSLYIFPSDVDARSNLVPFPCSSTYIASLTLWTPPVFTNLLVNGTVEGKQARLWKATKNYPQEQERTEFWYLATDGTPLFSFSAAFFGQYPEFTEYTFFQPGSPPPGVFDIPPDCTAF